MATGKIITKLRFGNSFNHEIQREIEDEIRIAQNKFRVNLTVDEEDFVKSKTLEQLVEKINDVFKYPFPEDAPKNAAFDAKNVLSVLDSEDAGARDLVIDFSEITVLIKTAQKGIESRLVIENDKEPDYKILIARTSSGFEVANEESKNSMWLEELMPHLRTLIKKWSRTGAYYSVGSFAR